MKKLALASVALACVAVLLTAAPTFGQPRHAGAKVRGEIARPSAPARSTFQTPMAAQPRMMATMPVEDPYRAFAFEPLDFRTGDTVVVVGEQANLMLGRRPVANVPQGESLRVVQIQGPWVGTVAEVDGRQVGGWIWFSQVAAQGR